MWCVCTADHGGEEEAAIHPFLPGSDQPEVDFARIGFAYPRYYARQDGALERSGMRMVGMVG